LRVRIGRGDPSGADALANIVAGTRVGARHGGSLVAAAQRRRARGRRGECQKGRGAEVEKAKGDAWKRKPAGGGAWGAVSAASGGGRSGARQRKTKQRCQGDLFVISKEFRDPSVN
jgi:hypothetical protein